MAFSKAFERELNKLFRRRTDWLLRKLGTNKPGKPPTFNKNKVDAAISKLQLIASNAFAHKLAKAEFDEHVSAQKNYHIKGHGPANKKKLFEAWFSEKFPGTKGLVYAFWGNKGKCIYIGRTGSHGSRPSSHFKTYWFSGVKRVTIFAIKGKSHIPKLECLAIHRFQPKVNKNKAATMKWTKACPLCATHKHIQNELRGIFRFR